MTSKAKFENFAHGCHACIFEDLDRWSWWEALGWAGVYGSWWKPDRSAPPDRSRGRAKWKGGTRRGAAAATGAGSDGKRHQAGVRMRLSQPYIVSFIWGDVFSLYSLLLVPIPLCVSTCWQSTTVLPPYVTPSESSSWVEDQSTSHHSGRGKPTMAAGHSFHFISVTGAPNLSSTFSSCHKFFAPRCLSIKVWCVWQWSRKARVLAAVQLRVACNQRVAAVQSSRHLSLVHLGVPHPPAVHSHPLTNSPLTSSHLKQNRSPFQPEKCFSP